MNKCGTCKFWRREVCKFWRREEGHSGECDHPAFVYGGETPKDGLGYWDYEGYSAGFTTGEDFGCIHHIPKDSQGSK